MRWRCADLAAVIKTRFGVKCHEISVGKVLLSMGFLMSAPGSNITSLPRHLWIVLDRRGTPRQFKPDCGMIHSKKGLS